MGPELLAYHLVTRVLLWKKYVFTHAHIRKISVHELEHNQRYESGCGGSGVDKSEEEKEDEGTSNRVPQVEESDSPSRTLLLVSGQHCVTVVEDDIDSAMVLWEKEFTDWICDSVFLPSLISHYSLTQLLKEERERNGDGGAIGKTGNEEMGKSKRCRLLDIGCLQNPFYFPSNWNCGVINSGRASSSLTSTSFSASTTSSMKPRYLSLIASVITIGFANNKVLLWDWQYDKVVSSSTCDESCGILYSMRILPLFSNCQTSPELSSKNQSLASRDVKKEKDEEEEICKEDVSSSGSKKDRSASLCTCQLLVCVGTIFCEVVIWDYFPSQKKMMQESGRFATDLLSCMNMMIEEEEGRRDKAHVTGRLLAKGAGHNGAVFQISWRELPRTKSASRVLAIF